MANVGWKEQMTKPLEVGTVVLWPGMMTAALSLAAAPCAGGCCFMDISLCTHCSQGHRDDAMDWDEGGVPQAPGHLMAAHDFP